MSEKLQKFPLVFVFLDPLNHFFTIQLHRSVPSNKESALFSIQKLNKNFFF